MRCDHRSVALFASCLSIGSFVAAQSPAPMVFKPAVGTTMTHHPALPACAQLAVQEGDPSKGRSTILMKATAGCVIPWHFHAATERLVIVSGTAKGEMRMKDMKPLTLKAGDYLVLPAKEIHQFTALTAVTLFNFTDTTFDIHYVDSAGKEIPPDQAVKVKAAK